MPTTTTRPRKTPKQDRSAATRARILEAGAAVFGEHGYAAGTTNRIAERAGLSIGSLYQYFPNKDAILVQLMRDHVEAGVGEIARRLADIERLPPALEDRVALFVDATMANHAGNPRLHRVLFEESPVPPDLRAELDRAEAWAVDVVASMLADEPTVRVDEPRLAAYVVVTTIESLTHRYLAGGDRYGSPDEFARQVIALVVAYLRR